MNKLNQTHLTEKGNLKAQVVASAKEQALAKIDLPLTATPNGDYAMILDEVDGVPFYLTVAITVGKADPFVKAVKKERPATAAVEVPELF